jgi:hypothetical protein
VLGILLTQKYGYGTAEHYLATQTVLIDKSIFIRGQACHYLEGECGRFWYYPEDLKRIVIESADLRRKICSDLGHNNDFAPR